MGQQDQSAKQRRGRSARRTTSAPTIADVARAAECSPMTVSRVINGEGNVRDDTRDHVLDVIKRLNYVPNRAARNLAGGSQLRVGLLFDNPSASYLAEFLMGAVVEAGRRDIHLEVQVCEFTAEAKGLIVRMIESGVGGFLLPPPLCDDPSVLDLITGHGAVAIAVGSGGPVGDHNSVMIDDFRAAYDMTRHIVALGHRRIGFIVGNPEQASSERRLDGYRAALEEDGIPIDEALIAQGRFTYRSGLAAAERLLALTPRPTAVFASNDDMAAATVAVAHRLHLDVPSDISVCGFDDTDMARTIWPELTTIRQPIREMTAWAVAAIARASKDKRGKAEQKVMPYQLIRRESDAAPSLSLAPARPGNV